MADPAAPMSNTPVGTGVVAGDQGHELVFFRGQEVSVNVSFMDGEEAVVPFDATQYPTYVLIAPNNALVSSGVGTDMGGGIWRAHWIVPADAPVGEWKISWSMYSTRQRTYQEIDSFTIREENEPLELATEVPAFVIMEGDVGERVTLLLDVPPVDLKLSVRDLRQSELMRFDVTTMGHEQIGTKTLWWREMPALSVGEWMLVWSYQRSAAGPKERVIKDLFVPPTIFWELYKPLDSYLDRIQKDVHQPFGYFEDDMYRYMKRGMWMLNQLNPVTQWDMASLPRGWGMEDWLVRCAAYWAFKDRAVTAGEMQFNYGGQEIQLDVERVQFYEQEATDLFNSIMQLAGKSKREVLRHMRSPARLGLRLGTGVSATLGGADLLGGITSPWLRGFSRSRRRGGGY